MTDETKEETPEKRSSERTAEVTVESSSTEPTNKKAKRTAERQITKDDQDGLNDDDEDEDSGANVGAPFVKASAEVLAGRKILKARRPAGSTPLTAAPVKPPVSTSEVSPGVAPSTATTNNPFAKTILTSSTVPISTTSTTAEKKIFGSGFGSGFASTVNRTNDDKNGTGAFGGGFAGFGTAVASSTGSNSSTNPTSGGFGTATAAATANKDTFVFGKPSSSSLFTIPSSTTPGTGTGVSSMFSFGFGKSNSATNASTIDSSTISGTTIPDSKATPSVVLPDQVELNNGEEQELNLHEARCKTFKWVPDVVDDDQVDTEGRTASSTTTTNEAAPPSVPSSNSFQVGPPKVSTQTDKEDDTNDNTNGPPAKTPSDKSNPVPTSDTPATQFRWQEIGVGPLKLLQDDTSNPPKYRLVQRRESTPNGPATKVLLNLPIYRESKASLKQGQENYLSFCTIGPEGDTETYLWKFKEVAQARQFSRALQGVLMFAKSCFGTVKN